MLNSAVAWEFMKETSLVIAPRIPSVSVLEMMSDYDLYLLHESLDFYYA